MKEAQGMFAKAKKYVVNTDEDDTAESATNTASN